jgi:hypothetical protein
MGEMRREMAVAREMARISDQIPFLIAAAMRGHAMVH